MGVCSSALPRCTGDSGGVQGKVCIFAGKPTCVHTHVCMLLNSTASCLRTGIYVPPGSVSVGRIWVGSGLGGMRRQHSML